MEVKLKRSSIKTIEINSDLGKLYFIPLTIKLKQNITKSVVDEVNDICRNLNFNCLAIIVNAKHVKDYLHVLYPLYLALRNHLQKLSFAKNVNVEALTYFTCNNQIEHALKLENVLELNIVSIAILCREEFKDKIQDIVNVLSKNNLIDDLVLGVGVVKNFENICRGDVVIEDIVKAHLDRFT